MVHNGMGRPKFVLAASAALVNAITVGFVGCYSSTATESMKVGPLNPTATEISWIGCTAPLGSIFGGVIAGYLSDKIGRKGVMMYLSVLMFTGWLLIACASSLLFVYAGRFITGICVGLVCVATPMYVVEVATPDVRGLLGSGFQLFICIGIILVSLLGKYLYWNYVAVCGSVLSVLAPLCMFFMPESPCWLLKKEKHTEAASAIRFLYGSKWEVSSEFIYKNYKDSLKNVKIDFRDPTVYKPALLSVLLMFLQQSSGTNAILYYTVSIFKEAKSALDPNVENILVAFIMCLFSLFSSLTMDKIGRKASLIISGLVTCVSLCALSTYLVLSRHNCTVKEHYGWIPLLCLLVYIAAYVVGLGPIPWLMMSEMSPTHARGVICAIGTAFSWFFAFVVTKTYVQLEEWLQSYGTYWLYSFFCLSSCFLSLFLPETKGKSFEEIKGFFSKNEFLLHRLVKDDGEKLRDPEV